MKIYQLVSILILGAISLSSVAYADEGDSNLDKYNLIENAENGTDYTQCGANQSLNPFVGVCTCNSGYILEQGQCVSQNLPSVVENNVVSPNYQPSTEEQASQNTAANQNNASTQSQSSSETDNKAEAKVGIGPGTLLASAPTERTSHTAVRARRILERVWTKTDRGFTRPKLDGSCGENQIKPETDQSICVCDSGYIMVDQQCIEGQIYVQKQQEEINNAYKLKLREHTPNVRGGQKGIQRR